MKPFILHPLKPSGFNLSLRPKPAYLFLLLGVPSPITPFHSFKAMSSLLRSLRCIGPPAASSRLPGVLGGSPDLSFGKKEQTNLYNQLNIPQDGQLKVNTLWLLFTIWNPLIASTRSRSHPTICCFLCNIFALESLPKAYN